MSHTNPHHSAVPFFTGRHRLEALTDGIYAIALTRCFVLDLKVPVLPEGSGEQAFIDAMNHVVPKARHLAVQLLGHGGVLAGQLVQYRLSVNIDHSMMWTEFMQPALVSLLPFTSAVMGEHGRYRFHTCCTAHT